MSALWFTARPFDAVTTACTERCVGVGGPHRRRRNPHLERQPARRLRREAARLSIAICLVTWEDAERDDCLRGIVEAIDDPPATELPAPLA